MSDTSKKVLSLLLVVGAQSTERGLSVPELAEKMDEGVEEVGRAVDELVRDGYVEFAGAPSETIHLTGTGIITASSTYS